MEALLASGHMCVWLKGLVKGMHTAAGMAAGSYAGILHVLSCRGWDWLSVQSLGSSRRRKEGGTQSIGICECENLEDKNLSRCLWWML